MYAAMVNVTIDAALQDEALAGLKSQVIPMVSASPGFITGYWLTPVDGKSPAMVVFETEEQARQAAPPVGPAPMPGVTVDSVEFREVAASA
jgi:hypothetical protein